MNYPIILFNNNELKNPNPNFYYTTKLDLDNSICLIKNKTKIILTSQMNKYKVQKIKKTDKNFFVYAFDRKATIEFLKKHIYNKKVGLDFESINVSTLNHLKKRYKIKPIDISQKFNKQRMKKNLDEIKKIKMAVLIAKKILQEVEDKIKPNLTELDVLKILKLKAIENNLELSFEPIVAADENSSNPHHLPTNKKIKKMVLIDFGIKYEYYCSDLTRCFFLVNDKKMIEKYEQAKQICFESIKLLKASKKVSTYIREVDQLLKEYKWEKMIHAFGHGIGLEVHELPFFSIKNKTKFLENSVVALEPGWYSKDFGIRYEENVLIAKNSKVL